MPFNPPIPKRKGDGAPSGAFGALVQTEKLIQVALILPCAVFIGWLGGDWLGHRLHQTWPIALGVILGGAAGLYYVIRLAMAALNDPANADETTGGEKTGKEDSSQRP